jgi:methionyl-tRNA formyltransferase
MKIVVANSNPIHRQIELDCIRLFDAKICHNENELTSNLLQKIQPEFVFFLHWSQLIKEDIYGPYCCILFHMTDLPYGRGGSPLQNLIVRGHTQTIISALRVEKGLDTGPIYLKKPLSLAGTAEEIFYRAGKIMLDMIEEIVVKKPIPTPQQGEPTFFKRRKPEESNLANIADPKKIFDYIRMLDAEGYPRAFLETEHFRFEFSGASQEKDSIVANVRIVPK